MNEVKGGKSKGNQITNILIRCTRVSGLERHLRNAWKSEGKKVWSFVLSLHKC
jgi:hypothetical protein